VQNFLAHLYKSLAIEMFNLTMRRGNFLKLIFFFSFVASYYIIQSLEDIMEHNIICSYCGKPIDSKKDLWIGRTSKNKWRVSPYHNTCVLKIVASN